MFLFCYNSQIHSFILITRVCSFIVYSFIHYNHYATVLFFVRLCATFSLSLPSCVLTTRDTLTPCKLQPFVIIHIMLILSCSCIHTINIIICICEFMFYIYIFNISYYSRFYLSSLPSKSIKGITVRFVFLSYVRTTTINR